MTQPPSRVFTPAWLSPADVKQWLKLNEADVDDDALVVRCCTQTEIYVQRCRPEFLKLGPFDPPVYDPDAEAYQGAVMYAAREVRRRNSPSGTQSFGDAGVVFVSKFDSDIERALHQGAWAKPGVG
ncbi:MAG TPA: hypothetical protein VNN79_07410 [Actinomycetota bacterium]|nr:hypothetical protein [Actinomycetota bacterium]